MNCMYCGALLTEEDYCPRCGGNILIQRKAYYLSNLYYNRGLEKASIRDLSGAIECLKRSLTFNKMNIQARNLLGLVYYETGEVVSALSEWVISKNLRPVRNLAAGYIQKLQANPNRLNMINNTIRKYNQALENCKAGHEDMAAIQLKKILSQNPKLIKGYHLLALIQIEKHAYNKARRTLKKAARIDKTNTTTLRFLKEIDEQTGVPTRLEERKTRKEKEERNQTNGSVAYKSGNELIIQPPAYKERSAMSAAITLGIGFLVGAAVFWFLVLPMKTQEIHRQVNQQITNYSNAIASQEAQVSELKGQVADSNTSTGELQQQASQAQEKSSSYEALLAAYSALQSENLDEAALQIQKVQTSQLSDSAKAVYDTVKAATGTSGIEEDTGNSEPTGQENVQ